MSEAKPERIAQVSTLLEELEDAMRRYTELGERCPPAVRVYVDKQQVATVLVTIDVRGALVITGDCPPERRELVLRVSRLEDYAAQVRAVYGEIVAIHERLQAQP